MGGAFAVLVLQNLPSAAAKPARRNVLERAFAVLFPEKQQTALGTGKKVATRAPEFTPKQRPAVRYGG